MNQVADYYFTPDKVFHIKLNGSSAASEGSGLARLHYRFWWLGQGATDNTCQSRFVCSKLEGNICGNYGLRVTDNSGHKDICYSSSDFQGHVNSGKALHVAIWHLHKPDMDLSCYVWCTENGSLPEPSEGQPVSTEFLQEIVR